MLFHSSSSIRFIQLISLVTALTFGTKAHAERKSDWAQRTPTETSGKASRHKKPQDKPFQGNRSPAVLPPTEPSLKSQAAQ